MKWLLALALVLQIPTVARAEELSHWYVAQPVPEKGPWFDGWYTRYLDRESGLTFAVISTADQLTQGKIKRPLQAQLSVLVQEPGSDQVQTTNFFGDSATVKNESDNFTWSSPQFGQVSHKGVSLRFEEGSLTTQLLDFDSAAREGDPNWGPMGWAQAIRFLPVHWYVATTCSHVSYKLVWKGKTYEGVAQIHTEKNWGKAFPKAWIWSQGFSDDGQAEFAVSGGPVKVGPVVKRSFLWVYRSRDLNFEVSPAQPLARFKADIDPCNNRLGLKAENSNYQVELQIQTNPGTFGYLSVPTASGYLANGAEESFSAVAIVEVRDKKSGGNEPLTKKIFHLSALEFGMEFMKCNKPGQ